MQTTRRYLGIGHRLRWRAPATVLNRSRPIRRGRGWSVRLCWAAWRVMGGRSTSRRSARRSTRWQESSPAHANRASCSWSAALRWRSFTTPDRRPRMSTYISSSPRKPASCDEPPRVSLMLSTFPGDWLNDAAKGFIHGLALGETVFESDSLTVRALAPEQLLAMKLCSWRDSVDFDDARLLLSKLTGNRTAVWARVEPFLVPGRETTACYAFEDLWENRSGLDAAD